ncbi:MAG TPA: tRNA (adenosine(37)-N6)-dimethylallyltransferase MiaA [bacterium]|nr:tRNA (adenosine(37)-N6)-dimethylallyltransferase MiaA [bacterium]
MSDISKLKTQNLKLPIIVGPTGVGKSEITYQLALRIKADVISADAYQVYRGLEVGTAQPDEAWRKKIPHHLVGIRKITEPWNAVTFAKEALNAISKVQANGRRPLIVGGAGFYLKALVEGAPEGKASADEIRSMVATKVKDLGPNGAHGWLKERDPVTAKRLHPNDTQRVCRALEKTFTLETTPFLQKKGKGSSEFKPLGEKNVRFIGLERSRDNLDRLLMIRTESIWTGGLLEETKALSSQGLQETSPLWGAIGYAEAAAYLRGEITQPQAIERIYRRTRQYAKRQWTWFKHQHEVEWINLDEFSDLSDVVDLLEMKIKL